MLISQINKILKSDKNHVWNTKTNILELCIDSRKLNEPANTLFFAIKGKNHDSHQFLDDLYEKGVRNFVVEVSQTVRAKLLEYEKFKECNIFHVKNSIDALQKVVIFHRKQFDKISVIGITGSNGKTIVKEWLSQCFSEFSVVKSPKSYNSQIGVPLSVAQINKKHTIGIFEAGISQVGEMKKLEKIISPNIGVLTNIGSAHDEGFESRAQKLKEKLQLFPECISLFFPKQLLNDFKDIFGGFNKKYKHTILISWDYSWNDSIAQKEMLSFETKKENYNGNIHENWHISVNRNLFPFTENDKTSIENALVCACVMHYFDFSSEKIAEKIKMLKPISMRLEIKQGIFNSYIIDDSYNNDVVGLSMALNLLHNQQQKTEKALILSDILETGLDDQKTLYKSVADIIAQKNITQFIGIGENITKNKDIFKEVFENVKNTINIAFFEDTAGFLREFPLKNFQNQVVLIKGARKFAFEKIVQKMQQKAHGTILEINLDALVHNLNFFRSQINKKTKIMVMVKAFAYGSGSAEVANLLQFHRVDYLAVAYTDEGVELRKNGIKLPIMVMNPSIESFGLLLEYDLEPEIYSFSLLNSFIDFVKNNDKNDNLSKNITSKNKEKTLNTIKIHLKLDTGMKRLGFEENDFENLVAILLKNEKNIIIASIMSHLAGADEAEHNDFSQNQITIFERFSENISKKIGYNPIHHIANSPTIVRFPNAQFDMIRLGIGLYGVEMSGIAQQQLMPISRLKTIISQIKTVQKGETVGYSRKGKMPENGKIATIAIGYADGFSRRFSNGVGEVSINGTLCKVIGNVCMDMTMIDISHLQDVQEGDEVIIFDEKLTISMLAKKINTIPYEILTSVSERVKRVFFTE